MTGKGGPCVVLSLNTHPSCLWNAVERHVRAWDDITGRSQVNAAHGRQGENARLSSLEDRPSRKGLPRPVGACGGSASGLQVGLRNRQGHARSSLSRWSTRGRPAPRVGSASTVRVRWCSTVPKACARTAVAILAALADLQKPKARARTAVARPVPTIQPHQAEGPGTHGRRRRAHAGRSGLVFVPWPAGLWMYCQKALRTQDSPPAASRATVVFSRIDESTILMPPSFQRVVRVATHGM